MLRPSEDGVDRGGQPGRAAAEHDDVEALAVDLRSQAQLVGDRGHRGSPDDAVGSDQDRALGVPDAEPVEQDPALFVGGEVVPGEGNEVALEQLPDGERLARPS